VSTRSILDRRLVIVTGKGGTGKSTVVAALALAASRSGQRVIAVETGRDEHVPRLLGWRGEPVVYAGRTLPSGPQVLRVEPYEALAEYLRLQLGVPRLVARVLRNRGFRQLMDAAPGWRELITLGKVWHLEQAREAGRRAFDLLLVDAPATGHGLTFLDVPRVVVQAVRAGPLRRHAGWVEEMIHDPEHTLLLPVALAEELPARETAELVTRLRDSVGIAIDRVVVNAVSSDPYPPGISDLAERLEGLAAAARPGTADPLPGGEPSLPELRLLAACARHLRSRFEMHRHYAREIARSSDLPTSCLPFLPGGVSSPQELEPLIPALLHPPGDPP